MKKNKYIMSSVKGTREEGEALETSIKERKKSHLKGVKGVEQYFPPHFPDKFYTALKFHLFPDV